MKKIFILAIVLCIGIQSCMAKGADKDYTLNFNGTKYHLLYSIKNKDFGGYLNEYYKRGETYNIWSDMIAIHHFPNAYSPIDRIKDFKDYLSSMQVPSSLTFDDKRNSATIDFIMITSSHMPVVLEFNIFKYEKSKKCGSVAVQYTKRYSATTTMQIEAIKRDFEKHRKKLIKKVNKLTIPAIVTEDIDKCISGSELNKETKAEILEEQKKEAELKSIENNEISEDINQPNTEETKETTTIKENISQDNDNSIQAEPKDILTEEINENNKEYTVEVQNESADKQEADSAIEETNITEIKTYSAPVPEVKTATSEINKKSESKIKNATYEIYNNKEVYIAKPRTKKELKEEIKRKKLEQKNKNIPYEITNNKSNYIAKPRSKKEMKEIIKDKKANKKARERAKQAKKKLSE